ncbi:YybH family protein [Actinoalloteichus hymeniacidonis]|uniref:YybH family protein n=1 Tax=Actinoalloteichus hymeniacidonis TaxID=340345 RepID=UPI001810AFA5|nr:DUF4440 domain-containing protein [Actinoalloteichus hymeniacidonis]MBB5905988.1 ketosteroid isomerase-like protein [Actinoalloteichus hymeniacidonis]
MSIHQNPIVRLTESAGEHPFVFASAFNSGRSEAVEAVYEPNAVLIAQPGAPASGAQRAAGNQRLLDLGLPIRLTPRHVYEVDDLALLIVDWVIEGTDADGSEVRVEGTATDVARRGEDGRWRYVIDNPFGTA